jgi:hypothetical protein
MLESHGQGHARAHARGGGSEHRGASPPRAPRHLRPLCTQRPLPQRHPYVHVPFVDALRGRDQERCEGGGLVTSHVASWPTQFGHPTCWKSEGLHPCTLMDQPGRCELAGELAPLPDMGGGVVSRPDYDHAQQLSLHPLFTELVDDCPPPCRAVLHAFPSSLKKMSRPCLRRRYTMVWRASHAQGHHALGGMRSGPRALEVL